MGRICIYLTNLGKYNEGCLVGEWVKLPISEDKLQEVLTQIGINNEYEEYFITDYESVFSNLQISEYASVEELNEFARRIEELADFDYDKLGAVLECESCLSITEILKIIDRIDDFDLIPGVNTDQELGEYYAEACGLFANLPEHIQRYIDVEMYGRDIRMELNCCYTSFGIVIDNR